MPRSLYMRYFVSAAVIIAADQLIKYWVRVTLLPGETIRVLGDFFGITHIVNNGAALGLLSQQRWLLMIVPALIIIAGVWYMMRHPNVHWTCKFSVTLILAGGIGNLIDRVAFGYVTDMFSFSIFPPVFNLADSAVTIGVIMLVLYVIIWSGPKTKRS